MQCNAHVLWHCILYAEEQCFTYAHACRIQMQHGVLVRVCVCIPPKAVYAYAAGGMKDTANMLLIAL